MTTTRPRTSGLNLQRRQSLRPFYEPVSPNVEEKEEDGAHILRLLLPDFEGQQVKVTIDEAGRTIGVTGERPMGNSRWIRLDKTYSIPEDCIIDKINHQFDKGILTISMPKPISSQAAADPPPNEDEVRPVESKEPEKDLPKVDYNASSMENKSAILEKQAADNKVEEELERKSTPEREDQKLIQNEEIKNQISEKEKEESKTEKEEIKKQISKKEKEELKTAKEEITNKISEKEKEKEKEKKKKEESKTEKEEIKKQISEKEKKKKEESKTEKEEIKKQISEKEKEKEKNKKEESKTEKESKEKKKPETTPKPASRVTRAAKLAGKFAIGRLPFPVKANLAATAVIVAAYFAYMYYRLPTN